MHHLVAPTLSSLSIMQATINKLTLQSFRLAHQVVFLFGPNGVPSSSSQFLPIRVQLPGESSSVEYKTYKKLAVALQRVGSLPKDIYSRPICYALYLCLQGFLRDTTLREAVLFRESFPDYAFCERLLNLIERAPSVLHTLARLLDTLVFEKEKIDWLTYPGGTALANVFNKRTSAHLVLMLVVHFLPVGATSMHMNTVCKRLRGLLWEKHRVSLTLDHVRTCKFAI